MAPLGSGFALHASYAAYKDKNKADDDSAKGYSLGVTKDLSKRTTLYATYGKTKNDDAVGFVHGGSGAAPAAGDDPSAYGVGIRHSF